MTKISQLADIGANLAANDEFIIRDVSDASTPNKKVTSSGFIDYVITQATGSGFTQISAGATAPASVRCFSSGTTREVIVTTSGVERARFTTAGQLRMAGAGITFNGDTATANELDDYEEGTWTPIVTDGTNDATPGATNLGRYTKIGNRVLINCFVEVNSLGSVTGPISVKGFPFTTANIEGAGGGAAFFADRLNIAAGQSINIGMVRNAATANLIIWDTAAGATQLLASELSSDGYAVFAFEYMAN